MSNEWHALSTFIFSQDQLVQSEVHRSAAIAIELARKKKDLETKHQVWRKAAAARKAKVGA